MDWELIVIISVNIFLFGAVFGKWITDNRWRNNVKVPYRLSCGGRLYKVKDVTPWD